MLDVLHWLPLLLRISYRIIALVWRSLLPLPIYVTSSALPWVLLVVALSALLSGACSWSLLPAQLLSRIGPSQWLAPPSGMGSLCTYVAMYAFRCEFNVQLFQADI